MCNVGYYSFVQYCPDRFIDEHINIGVVLFVPKIGFLSIRLINNNKRIRQFFGKKKCIFINEQKKFISVKLEMAKDSIISKDDFNIFRKRLGNDVKLSRLRSIKVLDPDFQLNRLFKAIDKSKYSYDDFICDNYKKHIHQGVIERKNKRFRIVCSCGMATMWVVKWKTAWNYWVKELGNENA